jgi:hypothetical protein
MAVNKLRYQGDRSNTSEIARATPIFGDPDGGREYLATGKNVVFSSRSGFADPIASPRSSW